MWISVKVALPEFYVPVLLYYENGTMAIGQRWNCSVGKQFDWENTRGDVTHWSPLPEPPKED